jgi:hypothetical protein
MSENITKEFTFDAPEGPYVVEGAGTRQITTTYKGADTIWVYVDVDTGKNPMFVSEGDMPDPTDTWRQRSVLLDANNDNHILLMELLSSSRGHTDWEEYTTYHNEAGDIEGAPEYVFTDIDLVNPPSFRYYDQDETHIDENGVITYAYKQPEDMDVFRQNYIIGVAMRIQATQEMLKDPVIIETPAALARCNRHIAVLTYLKDVLLESSIDPRTLDCPDLHEV